MANRYRDNVTISCGNHMFYLAAIYLYELCLVPSWDCFPFFPNNFFLESCIVLGSGEALYIDSFGKTFRLSTGIQESQGRSTVTFILYS